MVIVIILGVKTFNILDLTYFISSSWMISGTWVSSVGSSELYDVPSEESSIRGLLIGVNVNEDSDLTGKSSSEQDTLAQLLTRGLTWIADVKPHKRENQSDEAQCKTYFTSELLVENVTFTPPFWLFLGEYCLDRHTLQNRSITLAAHLSCHWLLERCSSIAIRQCKHSF